MLPAASAADSAGVSVADAVLAQLVGLLGRRPVHRVLPDACSLLAGALEGRVDLLLADYRQSVLFRVPLADGDERRIAGPPQAGGAHVGVLDIDVETLPVDGSWPGRCFAAQAVLQHDDGEGHHVLVPVTVRGDRLGVLALHRTGPVPPESVELLQLIAPVVAMVLASAADDTDEFERYRRRQHLTVAAELQWALLPGRSYQDDEVAVAGMLEPAYSIAGDAYDWSRDGRYLHLTVADGTGRGVPAALATTLAIAALRNARVAGMSLADQAALADQALFAHHGGETFVSALLFRFDTVAGTAAVIDAGSPLLFRLRGNAVEQVELDAQLPLGLFEETVYVEQPLGLEPGDRLVVVSDGVHASRTRTGPGFGTPELMRTLREARLLSPAETARHVVRALRAHLAQPEPAGRLDDDAAVVCLDWRPRQRRAR